MTGGAGHISQAITSLKNNSRLKKQKPFKDFAEESIKSSDELKSLLDDKMSEEEFLKFREKLESKKKKDSIILLILLGVIVLAVTLVALFLT